MLGISKPKTNILFGDRSVSLNLRGQNIGKYSVSVLRFLPTIEQATKISIDDCLAALVNHSGSQRLAK